MRVGELTNLMDVIGKISLNTEYPLDVFNCFVYCDCVGVGMLLRLGLLFNPKIL